MQKLPLLVLTIVLAAVTGATFASSAFGQAPLDLSLQLKGAMDGGHNQPDDRMVLLNLRSGVDGGWERIWGYAPRVSAAFISGYVAKADLAEDHVNLQIVLNLPHDGWSSGGRGMYEVKLTRGKDGQFEGAFVGNFRGVDLEGEAMAKLVVDQTRRPEGFTPIEVGERPRVLFRKADIPQLKKRLETPLGKAASAMWHDDAVGLGLRYQLMDDKDAPAQAAKIVAKLMTQGDCGSKNCRGRLWAARLEQIALAYDLCYDAWDEDFRTKVKEYLLGITDRLFFDHGSFQKEISWAIGGDMAGPIYYGAAVAGLALWGEKGPEPSAPIKVPDEPVVLAPPSDYTPGRGVPVVAFEGNAVPDRWICATGFPRSEDALQGKGSTFLPEIGTKLICGDYSNTFHELPDNSIWSDDKHTGGNRRLDVTAASKRAYNTANYFFTVIEFDRPMIIQYRNQPEDECWLAGQRLHEGNLVKVSKGRYPLLIATRIGETVPWGKISTAPRFVEVTAEEAAATIKSLKARYEAELVDWQAEHAQWSRHAETDTRCRRTFELGRWIMYTLYSEFIGEGGGQEPHRAHFLIGPHKYAALYRGMFGEEVTPREDLSLYLVRTIISQYRPGEGEVVAQGLHSRENILSGGFSSHNADVSKQVYAGVFPTVPEHYKPAVLWAWNYAAGVNNPGDCGKLLRDSHPYGGEGPDVITDVYAFLNYPLDMEPVHPSKLLPRTWEVPHNGLFLFRNQFDDTDDFIVQFFAKTRGRGPKGGTADAGAFRIFGLGEKWTDSQSQHSNDTWNENTVKLPNDPINTNAAGTLIHRELHADGSGVVTVDLSDVYSGGEEPLYEYSGGVKYAERFEDLGITGLRSFAVDYSGKSGSPCMIAIVDQIHGGDQRTWAWQLLREAVGRDNFVEDFDNVSVQGNTFTITKGNKTLVGTFIAPAKVDVDKVYREKGTTSRAPHPTIFATGGTHFFVVVTIQEGPAPEVSVEGKGLAAVVRVGGQTLAFDGTKIVMGAEKVSAIDRSTLTGGKNVAGDDDEEARPLPWTQAGFLLPAPLDEKAKVDPTDAVYTLVLRRGLGSRFEGAMDLIAYIDKTPDGFRTEAFGWTPKFNISPYDVDASGLKLDGAKLTGTLKVTMNPEPWTPRSTTMATAEYEIEATIDGRTVTGTFDGAYHGSKLSGAVVGLCQPRPATPETARVWFRSPRAIMGRKMHSWATRVSFDFLLTANGETSDLTVQIPFRRGEYGIARQEFSSSQLVLTPTTFAGSMSVEITNMFRSSPHSPTGIEHEEANQCARYAYNIQGIRVGNLLRGRIDTKMTGPTDFSVSNNTAYQAAIKAYEDAVKAGDKKAKRPKGHHYDGSSTWGYFIGSVLPADAKAPRMTDPERLGRW